MDVRFVVLVLLVGGALSFPTLDKTDEVETPSTLKEDPIDFDPEIDPVDKEDEVLETVEIPEDQDEPKTDADIYEVKFESPIVDDDDGESYWDRDGEDGPLVEVVGYERPHSRQKRWVSSLFRLGRIGYNAFRGYRAQRRMLSGVRSNRLKGNVREHFTKGNYGDAVKRYRDLGGQMKPFKNYAMEGYSSKVGNRRFTVRTGSSSRGVPTLHSHKITSRGRKTGPTDKVRFMGD